MVFLTRLDYLECWILHISPVWWLLWFLVFLWVWKYFIWKITQPSNWNTEYRRWGISVIRIFRLILENISSCPKFCSQIKESLEVELIWKSLEDRKIWEKYPVILLSPGVSSSHQTTRFLLISDQLPISPDWFSPDVRHSALGTVPVLVVLWI